MSNWGFTGLIPGSLWTPWGTESRSDETAEHLTQSAIIYETGIMEEAYFLKDLVG